MPPGGISQYSDRQQLPCHEDLSILLANGNIRQSAEVVTIVHVIKCLTHKLIRHCYFAEANKLFRLFR